MITVRRAMRYFSQPLICLLLFAMLVMAAPPQAPPQEQPAPTATKEQKKPVSSQDEQVGDTLELGVTNIVLPVTVIDKNERFVHNLTRKDFQVFEDNRPQPIIDFKVSTQVPIDIAILVDTSASVRDKLAFEKAAAIEFLQGLLEQSNDQILIGSFNDEIRLLTDYTRSRAELFSAVNGLTTVGRTRLYDAVFQVAQEKATASSNRRTAIVIITDGADTASQKRFKETLAVAQQKQIVIYALSTQFLDFDVDMEKPENQLYLNRGERELRDLCAQTGGKLFLPKDQLKLQSHFRQIREEMRNQYILVYEPSNGVADGRFRAIEVRLLGKLGTRPWQVRTRRGYVASREAMSE